MLPAKIVLCWVNPRYPGLGIGRKFNDPILVNVEYWRAVRVNGGCFSAKGVQRRRECCGTAEFRNLRALQSVKNIPDDTIEETLCGECSASADGRNLSAETVTESIHSGSGEGGGACSSISTSPQMSVRKAHTCTDARRLASEVRSTFAGLLCRAGTG